MEGEQVASAGVLCRADVSLFSVSLANSDGVTKINNFLGVPSWSSIKLDYSSSFFWPLGFYGLNEKQTSHSSTTIVLEGTIQLSIAIKVSTL